MGRKVTDDEIEEWLTLKNRNWTDKAIGEKYHRDPKTIGRHLKEYLERPGQGSPQHPELEALKRDIETQELLMKLETAREARMKIPDRLEELEATVKGLGADLEATVKALGEDLERLRLRFNKLPIADLKRNWTCSLCGSSDYPVIKVKCSRCEREVWFGFVCPPEKKIQVD